MPGLVNKAEVGVRIKEVLCDRAVRSRIDLVHKVTQIVPETRGLRMHFGIGSHFYVKVLSIVLANKSHQIAGITQFTRVAPHTRGQVTAQGNNTSYALVAVVIKYLA